MNAVTGCAMNGLHLGLLKKAAAPGFSTEVRLGPDGTAYWLADADDGEPQGALCRRSCYCFIGFSEFFGDPVSRRGA